MYSFEEVLRLDPQKFPDAFSKIIANIQAEIEEAQKAGLDDADIDELVKENCDDIVEKYPKLIIQKKTPTPATKKSVKQKASPSSVPCEDVNEELAKAMAEIKELKKVTTPAQEKVAEKAAEKAVRTADSVRAKRKKIANYSKKYVTGTKRHKW